MLEQEQKKEAAQETSESDGVVRQSAADYLRERIGEEGCIILSQSMKRMERSMQNHGYR